nr:phosphatase PAP2 family protein [Jiella flava]
MTEYDGLGQELGKVYLAGRLKNELPLNAKLLNIDDGLDGAFLDTGDYGKDLTLAKDTYFYPRPFVPTDANTAPTAGDAPACNPANINARDLASFRKGEPWATATGNLKIKRLATQDDTSGEFGKPSIKLDAEYGDWDMCSEPSFPSGHTADAYNVGITLATLLPEVAPYILARASESGNARVVLGVHYPLDVIGGRIIAEAGIAYRWSDPEFRKTVLLPARQELLSYIQEKTGKTVAQLVAEQKNYTNNPYGGEKMPGGSDQTVSDCASALRVYKERLTYGIPAATKTAKFEVPAGAENLLLTTYPSLTDKQRRAVLAMTASTTAGPLDSHAAGWARLDLAAAMSAAVTVGSNGQVTKVDATACQASVKRS